MPRCPVAGKTPQNNARWLHPPKAQASARTYRTARYTCPVSTGNHPFLFHYFAEWIAFRFLYSEKGSLAKIDGMDNGDALLLAFLIESEGGFVVMQGCIHRISDARQVACIHIFHRQRILSMR